MVQWKLDRFFDRFELYEIMKDATESDNFAEPHADVVNSLTAQMGQFPHRPPGRGRT
jgi:hypothetical protein